jgi:hypothetical protein
MQQTNDQVDSGQPVQPLDELYWRDEILQVMYWYRGEGFGESVSVRDLIIGLSEPVERAVAPSVERLVSEIHRLTGVPACDH